MENSVDKREHPIVPIVIAFDLCLNYTCRHNIWLKIYICTNLTHKWLGKIVGKSIRKKNNNKKQQQKKNEIRTYIKTHVLLGRGSKDIYADIRGVYDSYEMSFAWFVGRLGNLEQASCLLKVHLNLVDLSLQVDQGLLKKIKQIVKSDARYTSQQIADIVVISKASVLLILQNILKLKKKRARWVPQNFGQSLIFELGQK